MRLRFLRSEHFATVLHRVARCALAAGALGVGVVSAQSFPARPLKITMMFPAGGGSSDAQARALVERLRVEIGQPVVIENRVGGGGIIAAEYVKSQPADGYSILWSGVALMALTPKFNTAAKYSDADFVPVASLGTTPNLLIARADFPANDLKGLAEMAKGKPGQMSYATWGVGSVTHVGGEWFTRELGIQLNPVAYRGEVPTIQDMLGGHVQLGWSSLPSALPYLRSGQLKALATSGAARDPLVPEVRTFMEQGVPNFSIQGWTGLFVRKGTPPEVISLLHTKIVKILQEPEMQSHATSVGYRVNPLSIDQFSDLIRTDIARMMPTLDLLAPAVKQ
jgi:tripartite-type tricarboxylate transporter receptor subunit TctC